MFKTAVDNQPARTANDMKARASSANACTDLFFEIGASRGQDILPSFIAAYVENSDYALRIAQWARDIRGGTGERQLFRDILLALSNDYPVTSLKLMDKVPEIGRWDDLLLEYKNKRCQLCFKEYYPDDDIQILPCKHFFHNNCFNKYIKNNKCPICYK